MDKRVNVSGRREEHKETTTWLMCLGVCIMGPHTQVEFSVSVVSGEWSILKCYYKYIPIHNYLLFFLKKIHFNIPTHPLTHSTAEFQRKHVSGVSGRYG